MMEKTEYGFVVAAEKNGQLFFRSFHKTSESAHQSLLRIIDADAIRIVASEVTFAENGNVRRWNVILSQSPTTKA